jgi:hypothetical protein
MLSVVLLVLMLAAIAVAYHLGSRKPPLTVRFVGYTNSPSNGLVAVFTATNTSSHAVRRWTWEAQSGAGPPAIAGFAPTTLQRGQGERIEVPAVPFRWKLAVLTTGPMKGAWNKFLISTPPFVASNQLDLFQFDRSYSEWVFPPPPTANLMENHE